MLGGSLCALAGKYRLENAGLQVLPRLLCNHIGARSELAVCIRRDDARRAAIGKLRLVHRRLEIRKGSDRSYSSRERLQRIFNFRPHVHCLHVDRSPMLGSARTAARVVVHAGAPGAQAPGAWQIFSTCMYGGLQYGRRAATVPVSRISLHGYCAAFLMGERPRTRASV